MLPDRVSVLADIGERASDIDVGRAEEAMRRAADRLKQVRGEAGYDDVQAEYTRADHPARGRAQGEGRGLSPGPLRVGRA